MFYYKSFSGLFGIFLKPKQFCKFDTEVQKVSADSNLHLSVKKTLAVKFHSALTRTHSPPKAQEHITLQVQIAAFAMGFPQVFWSPKQT